MKQKLRNFFMSSWPHAVLGTSLILIALAEDEPLSMIIGMGNIMLAILNYEEKVA